MPLLSQWRKTRFIFCHRCATLQGRVLLGSCRALLSQPWNSDARNDHCDSTCWTDYRLSKFPCPNPATLPLVIRDLNVKTRIRCQLFYLSVCIGCWCERDAAPKWSKGITALRAAVTRCPGRMWVTHRVGSKYEGVLICPSKISHCVWLTVSLT